MDLEQYIRDIPDFPKEGIVFKDITPLLASRRGLPRRDRHDRRGVCRRAGSRR